MLKFLHIAGIYTCSMTEATGGENKDVFNAVAIEVCPCRFPEGLPESPVRQRDDFVWCLFDVFRRNDIRDGRSAQAFPFLCMFLGHSTKDFRRQQIEVGKAHVGICNEAF